MKTIDGNYEIKAYSGEDSIIVNITLNEEEISLDKTYLGSVVVSFDTERYYVISSDQIDEEDRRKFINFINRNIIKDIVLVEADDEIGSIQPNSKETFENLLRSNEIEIISQKEQEILDTYTEDLKNYHLGYKPEYEMLY